jgi:nucleotide-binding universal stress UspA family protein
VETLVANLKLDLKILHVRTADEIFIPKQKELKINGKVSPINSIKAKDIESGVLTFSRKNKVDLVMVLSKHHSVLYDLFAESHTKNIAFTSKVPVMAIHE